MSAYSDDGRDDAHLDEDGWETVTEAVRYRVALTRAHELALLAEQRAAEKMDALIDVASVVGVDSLKAAFFDEQVAEARTCGIVTERFADAHAGRAA